MKSLFLSAQLLAGVALGCAGSDAAASGEKSADEIEKAVAARRGKTELSKLAAKMKPGSWAAFSAGRPENLMGVKNSRGQGFHIAGWTDDGHWDSRTGQSLYYGFRQARKFIAYSEEKNERRVIPKHYKWPLKTAMGHIYGNNAHDPARSIFYQNAPASNRVYGRFHFPSFATFSFSALSVNGAQKPWASIQRTVSVAGSMVTACSLIPLRVPLKFPAGPATTFSSANSSTLNRPPPTWAMTASWLGTWTASRLRMPVALAACHVRVASGK
jgi:hypothetical protein